MNQCYSIARQSAHVTGNILYGVIQRFSPTQRLPQENKVNHFARELFRLIAKISSITSFAVVTVHVLGGGIPLVGMISGLALTIISDTVTDFLPNRIKSIAEKTIYFSGMFLIAFSGYHFSVRLMDSTTFNWGFIGLIASVLILKKSHLPIPDLCIQDPADQQTLIKKLEEIVQSDRQIKSLEIKNTNSALTLDPSVLENIAKIKTSKIILNGIQLSETTLQDLNKKLNGNSEAETMEFYYLTEQSPNHYVLTKTSSKPTTCEITIEKGETQLINESRKSYIEQFNQTKSIHWSTEKTKVIFNNSDPEANLTVTLADFQLIKSLDPESIGFLGNYSTSMVVYEALNLVSNSIYYPRHRGVFSKTALGDSYTIGYGETLDNETIKKLLESIQGSAVKQIEIINKKPKNEESKNQTTEFDLILELSDRLKKYRFLLIYGKLQNCS